MATSMVAPPTATTGRKRIVSSCTACYVRKQKCNRQFPCDHCTRRRRTEQCTYSSGPTAQLRPRSRQPAAQTRDNTRPADAAPAVRAHRQQIATHHPSSENDMLWTSWTRASREPQIHGRHAASLSEDFGYFEYSDSNTLGLLRKLGLYQHDEPHGRKDIVLPQKLCHAVQQEIARMPARPILDFLVSFFVAEVNWMSQLMHSPSFTCHYARWWTKGPAWTVDDVEFAILILRVCLLASQFLPSLSYTIDKIRGVPLTQIRDTCSDVSGNLATISARIDPTGSLIRLHYICFTGLNAACEGRAKESWAILSNAIHMAQGLGYRNDASQGTTSSPHDAEVDELEHEMRRRTFYNLYIWDSLLSRQLDRISFMQENFSTQVLPNMSTLVHESRADGAPEGFTERLLQVKLANFWKELSSEDQQRQQKLPSGVYDPAVAEEKYERFCKEFLANLPGPFALEPTTNKEWDKTHPVLPLQRHMLYITIFQSICLNFKPILLLEPNQIRTLPVYKRALVSAQTRVMALAAMNVLDAVSALHNILGTAHTRYADITFHTFEAAVLLMCLYISQPHAFDSSAAAITDDDHADYKNFYVSHNAVDGLHDHLASLDWGAAGAKVGLERCMQAAQDALSRLKMLAEISVTAETGAYYLARLIDQAKSSNGASSVAVTPLNVEVQLNENQMNWSLTRRDSTSAPPLVSTSSSLANVSSSDVSSNGFGEPNWDSFEYSYPSSLDEMLTNSTWSEAQPASKDDGIIMAMGYTNY